MAPNAGTKPGVKPMHSPPPREAYSVAEAAAALGVSKSSGWLLVRRGQMKTIKLGGRTLVRRDEITRVLDEASRKEARR